MQEVKSDPSYSLHVYCCRLRIHRSLLLLRFYSSRITSRNSTTMVRFYVLVLYLHILSSGLHRFRQAKFVSGNCDCSLIKKSKHIFGVLKRTVSMRWFFWDVKMRRVLFSVHNLWFHLSKKKINLEIFPPFIWSSDCIYMYYSAFFETLYLHVLSWVHLAYMHFLMTLYLYALSWIFCIYVHFLGNTGPRRAVGNVSGWRYVSDWRSRDNMFGPGPVPYFRGDWSWNNFCGRSPPFCSCKKGCCQLQAKVCVQSTGLLLSQACPRKKCG